MNARYKLALNESIPTVTLLMHIKRSFQSFNPNLFPLVKKKRFFQKIHPANRKKYVHMYLHS
jgi:hypothetical protein